MTREETKERIALMKLLGEFVCDDPTRANLMRVDLSPDRKVLAATDGTRLVRVTLVHPFLFPGDLGNLDATAGARSLAAGSLPVVAGYLPGNAFPPVDAVIPAPAKAGETAGRVCGFDARRLGDSLSAIATFTRAVEGGRGKQAPIQVTWGDDHKPVRIDARGFAFCGWELVAVVMPMRIS